MGIYKNYSFLEKLKKIEKNGTFSKYFFHFFDIFCRKLELFRRKWDFFQENWEKLELFQGLYRRYRCICTGSQAPSTVYTHCVPVGVLAHWLANHRHTVSRLPVAEPILSHCSGGYSVSHCEPLCEPTQKAASRARKLRAHIRRSVRAEGPCTDRRTGPKVQRTGTYSC